MWVIYVLIVLVLAFMLYGYLSNYHLTESTYHITTDKNIQNMTFAVVADLHSCKHGREYDRLMSVIDSHTPDAILIPGDMVIKHTSVEDEKVKRVLRLLDNLSDKYPVYYADGNHEIRMRDQEKYINKLQGMGINYLDNSNNNLDISKDNSNINTDNKLNIKIYGLKFTLEYYRYNIKPDVDELEEMIGKPDERCYNILLAHDPGHAEAYAQWGADLTVSGHLHGGIMRIPGLGGVISPGFRLFPKYDAGLYDIDGHNIVISRGLGTHHLKFRFFNPPEVVFIEIKSVANQ